MREQRSGMPVFVKVDEYKEILDVLDLIKNKVREVQDTLGGINTLRDEEDAEIEIWANTIKEIERKIEGIDKMMFEPEQTW